jgi:sialate O-acetylesterase
MKVEKNRIRIAFDNVIAGEDRKFYPAKAKIDKNTVIVSAKEVKKPVAVRFAWANGTIPNLFSKEGLPVPSFRTDSWTE